MLVAGVAIHPPADPTREQAGQVEHVAAERRKDMEHGAWPANTWRDDHLGPCVSCPPVPPLLPLAAPLLGVQQVPLQ
jgi:hypothetical protein